MTRADTGFATLLFLFLAPALGVQAGAPAAPPQGGTIGHGQEHQLANLGDFTFDSGETIADFRMSYVTWGEPNEAEDNVILLLHGFTQDHHALDYLIGAGLALDPERYFIIAPDALGNSYNRQVLSTGPTNSGMKMDFPAYTVDDTVRADMALVRDYLGFAHVRAVIGDSSGATKAYRLAVAYPNFAAAIVPIAGAPSFDRRSRAVMLSMIQIIELDPAWYSGRYETNPVAGLQTSFLNYASWLFGRSWFETGLATEAQAVSYWLPFHGYIRDHDARDVHYQLRANAADDGLDGDADAALRSIAAKTLIFAATTDAVYDIGAARHAAATIPDARLIETDTAMGHLICCGFDPEFAEIMNREIADLLAGPR